MGHVREPGLGEEILGRDWPSPGSRPETCPKVVPEDPFVDFVGGSWGGLAGMSEESGAMFPELFRNKLHR